MLAINLLWFLAMQKYKCDERAESKEVSELKGSYND